MRKPTHAVTVHVPGLPGAEYVWRRRTVYVNKTEFNQIRQWKIKGWGSKSAMVCWHCILIGSSITAPFDQLRTLTHCLIKGKSLRGCEKPPGASSCSLTGA